MTIALSPADGRGLDNLAGVGSSSGISTSGHLVNQKILNSIVFRSPSLILHEDRCIKDAMAKSIREPT
jgi:hypothetical protein